MLTQSKLILVLTEVITLSFVSPVSSGNLHHRFLLLQLCNIIQSDQHNHLSFFFLCDDNFCIFAIMFVVFVLGV